MRHGEGAREQLEKVARLHKVVRIEIGKICVCVVQLVGLAEVGEGNHARQQSNAAPPEVRGFSSTQVTVNALVSHHGADEDEVSAKQNVDHHQQRIRDRNEERAYREQNGETYNCAAEIVDSSTALHSLRNLARS